MAFLDNIFSNDAYSGLLGNLLSRFSFPQPQPSTGFPDSTGSYGGVPYPIFGTPQDEPATTTLSAQSVQPQAQPVQAQTPPSFMQPQSGGLGAGLRGFIANAHTGPIGALLGGVAGVAGMGQGNPAQVTYGALRAAGVPDALAQAASLHPEILKTIAPAYFDTAPKLQETGTNPFTGQKTFGVYKPNTQTLTEAPIRPASGQSQQQNLAQTAMQNGLTGEPFLEAIKNDPNFGPQEVNIIKKMVTGDIPPPSSFSLAKPQWATRIAMASQYDPTFSAATWTSRFAMARDASTGTVAKTNNALNTGIGHITQLADAVQNLNNTNFTPANWIKNIVKPAFGDTGVTNFEAIKNRVAPEITRIWRGANGAEQDIKRDLDTISTSRTPAQLYGAIMNIAGLMRSKIEANQKQYSDAMGPNGKSPDFMISKENMAALKRVEDMATGGAPTQAAQGTPEGAIAINPRTGQKIIKKNGNWVPMQ